MGTARSELALVARKIAQGKALRSTPLGYETPVSSRPSLDVLRGPLQGLRASRLVPPVPGHLPPSRTRIRTRGRRSRSAAFRPTHTASAIRADKEPRGPGVQLGGWCGVGRRAATARTRPTRALYRLAGWVRRRQNGLIALVAVAVNGA